MKNNVKISISELPTDNYLLSLNNENVSFYLLPEYSNIFKALGIGSTLYVNVYSDNKQVVSLQLQKAIIGGTLVTFLPNFVLNTLKKLNFLNTITGHMQPMITSSSIENLKEYFLCIIEFLELYCKKSNYSLQVDMMCFENDDWLKTITNEYRNLCATARIKLDRSEEEIFEKFPKSIKNTLNKDYKTLIKEVGYTTYYKHLSNNWKDMGLAVNSKEYYKALSLIPNNKVKYFLAYSKDNKVLSGSAIGFGNKTMIEFSMFSTKESREAKIPGGDILKWELIKLGIKNKVHYLDLNMIDVRNDMDKKSEDINFFKTKWGVEKVYGIKIEKFSPIIIFIRKVKILILGK